MLVFDRKVIHPSCQLSLAREEAFRLAGRFQSVFGTKLTNPDMLARALTHKSCLADAHHEYCNEGLEWLGDRVLNLLLAKALWQHFYPDLREGHMTRIFTKMISNSLFADVGNDMDIKRFMLVGSSKILEIKEGKGSIDKQVANTLEAVSAALFLDKGEIVIVEKVVGPFLFPRFKDVDVSKHTEKQPMTVLHEIAAQRFRGAKPYFRTVGRDHKTEEVIVEVSIKGRCYGRGQGKSLRLAKIAVAEIAVEELNKEMSK